VDISIRAERSSGVANATTDERSLFIQLAAGGHLFAHVWIRDFGFAGLQPIGFHHTISRRPKKLHPVTQTHIGHPIIISVIIFPE
jgi:hypothetical protein